METTFKFLGECDPLELVRVKLNEMSLLGIVAAPEGQARQGVIVLSLSPPSYVVFKEDGHIFGDFENFKMLSYGNTYSVDPEHVSIFKWVKALCSRKQAHSC